MTDHFKNPSLYCLGTRLNHPVTLIFGKNQNIILVHKKMTNN